MDAFEKLYAIATGPGDVLAKTRAIIGQDQLALALAKLALQGTTMIVSPTEAGKVLEMPKSTAANRIDAIGLKEASSGQRGR
ncbi:MAG TPA: hypothetical protein VGY91_07480 [Chthoniobacterales bacterium]|jgi:hypothetical protein|nr:hypothetical protein [Chthoniobacterales bacterium]